MSLELIHLLLLIIIANGAPILARVLLCKRFGYAIDFGKFFFDNRPLFGPSKTWRGVIAALLATVLAAILLGYSAETGACIACYAVSGDLVSSFIKRRLGMSPSSMALFMDQVPESLLPAIMMKNTFMLDFPSLLLLVSMFIVLELTFSQVLYRWRIRKRPY